MKSNRLSVLMFCLILTTTFSAYALPLIQTEPFAPLIGTWDVELAKGTQWEFVFTIKDGVLIGELVMEEKAMAMENILFKGNKLSFSISQNGGGKSFLWEFAADMDGEGMEGYLDTAQGGVEFTAVKRK
jgi:hypothetical protein